MNKKELKELFWNMPAMKYYEPNLSHPKAQKMINNQNGNNIEMIKWDGEWNMAIIFDDEVLMRSRNKGVAGDYKNRANWLPHITAELQYLYPSGTVLLGEICFDDITKTSKDVGTIMRCNVDKALFRQKKNKLSFKIFDCLAFNFKDIHELEFLERMKIVKTYYISDTCAYQSAKYTNIGKIFRDNFMERAEKLWAKGGEGMIIIKADEPYRPGKRKAWTSLKIKKKLGKIKVKIIDIIDPNINYEGEELDSWKYFIVQENIKFGEGISSIWIDKEFISEKKIIKSPAFRTIPVTKPYWHHWKNGIIVEHNGNKIRITSGLDDATREWLATSEAIKLLEEGKLYAIITAMEETQDSLRHPVFLKIDKND